MKPESSTSVDSLVALRAAFDGVFARPPAEEAEEPIAVLAIRAGTRRIAIRLADLSGVEVDRRIVSVPSRGRLASGLAGVRGSLVPVFSLAEVLGDPPSRERGRWLAVHRSDDPVGLSFDELEGFVRIPGSAVRPLPGNDQTSALGAVDVSGGLRPLVDLARLVAALDTTNRIGR